MPTKAKPKTGGAARASKPRTPAATAAALTKASAKAKPAARPADAKRDWREATLDRMRALILEADPGMTEERKWRKPSNAMEGIPVWSHDGMVCTGETYKNVVKLTFAYGASLPDPAELFNSSLDGGTRRAIDIHEGEQVDARAFKALVKAAVAQNGRSSLAKSPPKGTAKPKPAAGKAKSTAAAAARAAGEKVVLLAGGNPQIPKGDGDAPVQRYIAAMPGWKREIGERLDALVVRHVPEVRKAVRWNSPFYGVEGQGWFLSFHVFARFVKVTFFAGKSLRPLPPGGTPKSQETRWVDIHEGELDEAQMAAWVKQAAALPGWVT